MNFQQMANFEVEGQTYRDSFKRGKPWYASVYEQRCTKTGYRNRNWSLRIEVSYSSLRRSELFPVWQLWGAEELFVVERE